MVYTAPRAVEVRKVIEKVYQNFTTIQPESTFFSKVKKHVYTHNVYTLHANTHALTYIYIYLYL